MKLRIGIIGVGNMGTAHANCIHNGEIENLTLTCLCDTDKSRCEALKEKFPKVAVFGSYIDLIKSGLCDCVLICTPHYYHPEIAICAFRNGLHVLTEKPAGVSVSDVRKMNEEAKLSGRVFSIMFNQRTNPLYKKAREIIQSGALGIPKRLVWIITNWYRTQAYYDSGAWRATWSGEGGGVLINQAPHNLDLWQWIFGMPKKVRAFCYRGKYHKIEVEDDATIFAEYENGATATFITSTGECPGTNRLEITGDKGKLVLEGGKLHLWTLPEPERKFCFTCKDGFFTPETTYKEILPEGMETAHRGIIQNFVNAILYGEPLIASGFEGINELLISNAAYLSAWTNDFVTIPFDEELFDKMLHSLAENEKNRKAETDVTSINDYQQRWQVRW